MRTTSEASIRGLVQELLPVDDLSSGFDEEGVGVEPEEEREEEVGLLEEGRTVEAAPLLAEED